MLKLRPEKKKKRTTAAVATLQRRSGLSACSKGAGDGGWLVGRSRRTTTPSRPRGARGTPGRRLKAAVDGHGYGGEVVVANGVGALLGLEVECVWLGTASLCPPGHCLVLGSGE